MRSNILSLFAAGSLVLLSAGLSGCGKKADDRAKSRPAPESAPVQSSLVGSESAVSLQVLHDTVYARALRGDTLGLLRLFVRDSVYRAVVWPTQPSYEPDRDEVWMLVSGMNKANSNKGLRRLLADIELDAAAHGIPEFKVKDVAGGKVHSREKRELRPGELSLFAAALCREGGCQVLTYANAGRVGQGGQISGSEDIPDSGDFEAP